MRVAAPQRDGPGRHMKSHGHGLDARHRLTEDRDPVVERGGMDLLLQRVARGRYRCQADLLEPKLPSLSVEKAMEGFFQEQLGQRQDCLVGRFCRSRLHHFVHGSRPSETQLLVEPHRPGIINGHFERGPLQAVHAEASDGPLYEAAAQAEPTVAGYDAHVLNHAHAPSLGHALDRATPLQLFRGGAPGNQPGGCRQEARFPANLPHQAAAAVEAAKAGEHDRIELVAERTKLG